MKTKQTKEFEDIITQMHSKLLENWEKETPKWIYLLPHNLLELKHWSQIKEQPTGADIAFIKNVSSIIEAIGKLDNSINARVQLFRILNMVDYEYNPNIIKRWAGTVTKDELKELRRKTFNIIKDWILLDLVWDLQDSIGCKHCYCNKEEAKVGDKVNEENKTESIFDPLYFNKVDIENGIGYGMFNWKHFILNEKQVEIAFPLFFRWESFAASILEALLDK